MDLKNEGINFAEYDYNILIYVFVQNDETWEVQFELPEDILRLEAYRWNNEQWVTQQIEIMPCEEVLSEHYLRSLKMMEGRRQMLCLDPKTASTFGLSDYADDAKQDRIYVETKFCSESYSDEVTCRNAQETEEFFNSHTISFNWY